MPALCFGGSFNPIHHGHLICARAAAERDGFDRVVLIPTAQPPHKPDSSELAPAADRLEMCRLAAAGSPLFAVDDIELRLPLPSFTIETARELARRGSQPVYWLIGADMLLYLPKWHAPDALLREVKFVVMARPGWSIDWQSLPAPFGVLQQSMVEVPQIEISASEIRRRVAGGRSIDYLCPPAVCDYIHKRGLYRGERV